MSRELLARAWAAGAGPGDAPFTIDLDSTICETYGMAKEGARHHGYTGARGYHPLLATATGDLLMSRLRQGQANTVRGAAHFLRETVGRVRHAGAKGQLTVRADSGFYTQAMVSTCRKMNVRFSITVPQRKSLHSLIEAIPEEEGGMDAHPLLDGRRRRCGRDCLHPFQSKPDASPCGSSFAGPCPGCFTNEAHADTAGAVQPAARDADDYTATLKLIEKVLDFIQFGGPARTELRTFRWEVSI